MLVTIFVILGIVSFSQAQVNSNAIGLRLGGGDINGAEISYQNRLSNVNRLELDLGFGTNGNHDRIFLAGIYHWVRNIDGGFNWFIGPGASVGYYSYDNSDDINVAVGGQIGVEYDFQDMDLPLLLSLDARPMWDLLGDNTGLGWGVALGIRYIW